MTIMDVMYESTKKLSIYDHFLDGRFFSVQRYYCITYPFRDMKMLHAHTETEIMYTVSGNCTVNLENISLPLHEGEGVFIDSLVPHSLTVEPGKPCRVLNLEASLVAEQSMLSLCALEREEAFVKLRTSRLSHFFAKDEDNIVRNGIVNLQRLLAQQAPAFELDMQFSLVLLEMCRQKFHDHLRKPMGKPPYVKIASQFIRSRFDSEITVDDVAAAAGVSKAHLQRTFARYEGCTLVEAINRLRLEKARFLLVTSGIPVVDVANDVGFSSRQYFSSLFTRATGLSPTEFRKRQRGNIASGFGTADMGVVLSIRRD